MKKNEIKVGGKYLAKVSGKLTTVRVDAIRERENHNDRTSTVYDVTNLATGQKTTFRSAAKFRKEAGAARPTVSAAASPVSSAASTSASMAGLSDYTEAPELKAGPTWMSGDKELQNTNEDEHRPDPTELTAGDAQNAEASTRVAIDHQQPRTMSDIMARRNAKVDTKADTSPHLIVEARAGTGKTTTLVEGLKRLKGCPTPGFVPSPQQAAVFDSICLSAGKVNSICFVAFNKSIAEELKRRVPAGCEAMTMHGMGFRAVTRAMGRQEPTDWAVRDHIAAELGRDGRELGRDPKWMLIVKATEELVSLCKMNLSATDEQSLDMLARHYDVELNGGKGEVYRLVPLILERCKQPKGKISYDDMIWLPVVLGLPVTKYDMLLVDEAQDLNRCQQALAKLAGKRLILCGDPKQAIYGFAGADAESMPRMAAELINYTPTPGKVFEGGEAYRLAPRGCITLPLTVTRRCGHAIVAEAKKIVPDFEAFPTNPQGQIWVARFKDNSQTVEKTNLTFTYHQMVQDGDMILCRVNAPLVSECFKFIRAGRKANIQGRDIGKGLVQTVEKLRKASGYGANSVYKVTEFIGDLTDWLSKETEKEQAKRNPSDARIIAMQDRADCLICFTEGCDNAEQVIGKIQTVFTDDRTSPGIKLSSVHKAKGLESRRVFILEPEGAGMPHPMSRSKWQLEQEWNLKYVAITRAIEELVFVS